MMKDGRPVSCSSEFSNRMAERGFDESSFTLFPERVLEAFERAVDKLARDDERRLDAYDFGLVERVGDEHVALEHARGYPLAALGAQSLDADQKAAPAHVADEFGETLPEFFEAVEEVAAHLGGVLDEVLFLKRLNRGGGGGRRHRVRAEGGGVIEGVRVEDPPDFVRRVKRRAGDDAA